MADLDIDLQRKQALAKAAARKRASEASQSTQPAQENNNSARDAYTESLKLPLDHRLRHDPIASMSGDENRPEYSWEEIEKTPNFRDDGVRKTVSHYMDKAGEALSIEGQLIGAPSGKSSGLTQGLDAFVSGTANLPSNLASKPLETVDSMFFEPVRETWGGYNDAIIYGADAGIKTLEGEDARPSLEAAKDATGRFVTNAPWVALDAMGLPAAVRPLRKMDHSAMASRDIAAGVDIPKIKTATPEKLPKKVHAAVGRLLENSGVPRERHAEILEDLSSNPINSKTTYAQEIVRRHGVEFPDLSTNIQAIGRDFSVSSPTGKKDNARRVVNDGVREVLDDQGQQVARVAEDSFGVGSVVSRKEVDAELKALGEQYNTLLDPSKPYGKIRSANKRAEIDESRRKLTDHLLKENDPMKQPEWIRSTMALEINKALRQMGEPTLDLPISRQEWETLVVERPTQVAHWLQHSYAKAARDARAGVIDPQRVAEAGVATEKRGKSTIRKNAKDAESRGYGLLKMLEDAVPGYKKTRIEYGTEIGALDALDLPKKFLSIANDEDKLASFLDDLDDLSPSQFERAKSQITTIVRNELNRKIEAPSLSEFGAGERGKSTANLQRLSQRSVLRALEDAFGSEGEALANAVRSARSNTDFLTSIDPKFNSRTQVNASDTLNAPKLYEHPAAVNKGIIDTAAGFSGSVGIGALLSGSSAPFGISMLAFSAARAAWNAHKKGLALSPKQRTDLAKFWFEVRKAENGIDGTTPPTPNTLTNMPPARPQAPSQNALTALAPIPREIPARPQAIAPTAPNRAVEARVSQPDAAALRDSARAERQIQVMDNEWGIKGKGAYELDPEKMDMLPQDRYREVMDELDAISAADDVRRLENFAVRWMRPSRGGALMDESGGVSASMAGNLASGGLGGVTGYYADPNASEAERWRNAGIGAAAGASIAFQARNAARLRAADGGKNRPISEFWGDESGGYGLFSGKGAKQKQAALKRGKEKQYLERQGRYSEPLTPDEVAAIQEADVIISTKRANKTANNLPKRQFRSKQTQSANEVIPYDPRWFAKKIPPTEKRYTINKPIPIEEIPKNEQKFFFPKQGSIIKISDENGIDMNDARMRPREDKNITKEEIYEDVLQANIRKDYHEVERLVREYMEPDPAIDEISEMINTIWYDEIDLRSLREQRLSNNYKDMIQSRSDELQYLSKNGLSAPPREVRVEVPYPVYPNRGARDALLLSTGLVGGAGGALAAPYIEQYADKMEPYIDLLQPYAANALASLKSRFEDHRD